MGEKLSHVEHKIIIAVLIIGSIIIGITFSRTIVGSDQNYDAILTLIFGLVFVIAVLLIVILSILVRLEEDFYWYVKKKIQ